jgi:hypothetical protein
LGEEGIKNRDEGEVKRESVSKGIGYVNGKGKNKIDI